MANNSSATEQVERSLEGYLPFIPTGSQSRAIHIIARFLLSKKPRCSMILKGYAGTGKTTLMQALVRQQKDWGRDCILLAPTGRAAKVLGNYAKSMAFTIHRYIYMRTMDDHGNSTFSLRPNLRKNILFIVDEASMLSDMHSGVGGRLLTDLMQHVFSGTGCRVLLLGDDAQLPPIGVEESPALDLDLMRADHDLTVAIYLLDEVVRQAEGSAILELATAIRKRIFSDDHSDPRINYLPGPEVVHITSRDLHEKLEEAYDHQGREHVRIVCRSNKSANLFNKQIRAQVFQMDDEICAGEMLMIVKNNYLWAVDVEEMPFIANGEMCEVMYTKQHVDRYGLRFVTLGLNFTDQEGVGTLECKALLDTLEVKSPSMPKEVMDDLYGQVREDLSHEVGSLELKSRIKTDEFFNALQIKYGYAVTCHKAQGGQWPTVFVDRGFIPEDGMNREYWRWLYTASTRATDRLYLIDF